MKIGPDVARVSSISGSNAETIVVRGYDLVDSLVGSVSFTDHIWLLVTGSLPSPAQRAILDATLVAIAEHGLVPSVVAARMTFAAAPEALQGAVAAGLLGCGSVILGSAQAAGVFLHEIEVAHSNGATRDDAIATVVRAYRADRRAVPGFGHPLHKAADPRAARLFAVAQREGSSGVYEETAFAVERLLPEFVGRPLRLNVSGAIAAVLLDAEYPLLALKGVPLIARTASLVAHLLEEQIQPIGFAMSEVAASAIRYTGPAPEGFVAGETVR
jgi:citrate synthase